MESAASTQTTSFSSAGNSSASVEIPVGEILRRTREHYNQSYENIEHALRIRAAIVKAIEEGDERALPGAVYTVGFIRSYANHLGLDGERLVQLYKKENGQAACPAKKNLDFPVSDKETQMPSIWLVSASFVVMIFACVFYFSLSPEQTATMSLSIPEVPPPVEQEASADKNRVQENVHTVQNANVQLSAKEAYVYPQPPNMDTDRVAENMQSVEPAAGNPAVSDASYQPEKTSSQGIILVVTGSTWVEVSNTKGEKLVSKELKSGDRYFIPDRPDLLISISNAGAMHFEIGGDKIQPLGEEGEIKKNIPLTVSYIMENSGNRIQ